jgi:GTP-binding nuclear protein Ran
VSRFQPGYILGSNTSIQLLVFNTSKGQSIAFQVYDMVNQEKFGGLRDGYYLGSHCAIIMYDVNSRLSYKNIPLHWRDIRRICDEIPVCLVGNKCDLGGRLRPQKVFQAKYHLEFVEMSATLNSNILAPFTYLARCLRRDPDLILYPRYAVPRLDKKIVQSEGVKDNDETLSKEPGIG